MSSKINNIMPKEAETKFEKLLLGFISGESDRIQYGKIILEITVYKGKPTNAQSSEIKRSLNLGGE